MEVIIGLAILLGSLAGIVTSLALLWSKIIRPTYKFFGRVSDLVEVMHDLPEWCESVDETLKELKPNGGGSIKDKISKIQTSVDQHLEDHENVTPNCTSYVPILKAR